ncbi:hypothetical protein VT06_04945 [Arsukibacterium sp. MJ3]|nr:hypothetical protein VT06_04945 [Arsukibacterium sp. MJ3]
MINDFDVIHMGGRTYNPILGRFMQADPFIQAPGNLQNYNRYSYVLNNPMSYTDPSGYFFKKLNKMFGKLAPFVGLLALAIPGVGPWAMANWYQAAAFGFMSGGVATGNLRGAIVGAISGAAFQQIGSHFKSLSNANLAQVDRVANDGFGALAGMMGDNLHSFGGLSLSAGQVAGQIASHAAAGGIVSVVSGGKFGHGFFSAGVTKGAGGAFLPGGSNLSGGQIAYGTVVSAVIGGTASELAGGKFSNGARTATFQYLFNHASESFWGFESLDDKSAVNVSIEQASLTLEVGPLKFVGLNRNGEFSGPSISGSRGPLSATLSTDSASIALAKGPISFGMNGVTAKACSHGPAGGVCFSATGMATSPKGAAALRNVNRATRATEDQSGRVRVYLYERLAPTYFGPSG